MVSEAADLLRTAGSVLLSIKAAAGITGRKLMSGTDFDY